MVDTFGYSAGGAGDVGTNGLICGVKAIPAKAGKAVSISVLFDSITSGKQYKCALYDNAGNFVASTQEYTSDGTTGWITFNFTSPVAITKQNYWIVAWGNGNGTIRYNGADSGWTGILYWSAAYGTWPSNYNGSADYANTGVDLYCTYTPVSPPGGAAAKMMAAGTL